MTASLLEARAVGMAFGSLPVLRDISFSLAEGEIVCILGVSGCGKTTLLNILTGLVAPAKGGVFSNVKRPGPDVGYMTQDNPLLPWRTVVGNVGIGMEFHKFDRETIRKRCAHYLDMVRLADFSEAWPHQLSGGMRQRVALARTLTLEPKLLLLDEPLGSLDVPGRRRLSKAIKSYVKDLNAGAVVVTHSVEEAVFLADRVLLLSPRPATVAQSFEIVDAMREHAFDAIMQAFLALLPEETPDAA